MTGRELKADIKELVAIFRTREGCADGSIIRDSSMASLTLKRFHDVPLEPQCLTTLKLLNYIVVDRLFVRGILLSESN